MFYTRRSSPTVMARWGGLNLAIFQLNTQVWLCALRSVGGFMAGKTVAVMSLQQQHQQQQHRSASLPRRSLLCQHCPCIPMSCMQETANVTASHRASWDMSSINSTQAPSMGDQKKDRGHIFIFGCVHNYCAWNNLKSHQKQHRADVIDGFDVTFFSF